MVYTQALVFGNGMTALSEDGVAELLRKLIHQFTSNVKNGVEDPRLEVGYKYRAAEKLSDRENLGPMEDFEDSEEILQVELAKRIELCLSDAKTSRLHCRELHLPRQLTGRIAHDILRSSADEPCGLRGALIQVFLESKGTLQPLGTVTPDRSVTPTFELSVVLKADSDGWPALKQLFVTDKVLRLCPSYKLVKRKLYSSASPVICEFI
ncbi:DNA damage-inducible transcript 4-like protein [Scleropages formosus]|nr:DNA damage-inducible transcript 4-like protein [Scleropages formosus]